MDEVLSFRYAGHRSSPARSGGGESKWLSNLKRNHLMLLFHLKKMSILHTGHLRCFLGNTCMLMCKSLLPIDKPKEFGIPILISFKAEVTQWNTNKNKSGQRRSQRHKNVNVSKACHVTFFVRHRLMRSKCERRAEEDWLNTNSHWTGTLSG